MHPLTSPDQSIQFAAERANRLRADAATWRRARRATRATHETRPAA